MVKTKKKGENYHDRHAVLYLGFTLTVLGRQADGLCNRVGIDLESDGATQTRTLQMHVYKSSPGSIELDDDLVWSIGLRGVARVVQ